MYYLLTRAEKILEKRKLSTMNNFRNSAGSKPFNFSTNQTQTFTFGTKPKVSESSTNFTFGMNTRNDASKNSPFNSKPETKPFSFATQPESKPSGFQFKPVGTNAPFNFSADKKRENVSPFKFPGKNLPEQKFLFAPLKDDNKPNFNFNWPKPTSNTFEFKNVQKEPVGTFETANRPFEDKNVKIHSIVASPEIGERKNCAELRLEAYCRSQKKCSQHGFAKCACKFESPFAANPQGQMWNLNANTNADVNQNLIFANALIWPP